jgi:hypothetical protein
VLPHVLFPHDRQKQWSGTSHYTDIRQYPVSVIVCKFPNHELEERMLRHSAHRIVADTRGHCSAKPSWVAKQRVESAIAAIIQIYVYAAIVVENKVSDGIGAFNREGVGVESSEEPFVLFCDEGAGFLVCPEL